MSCKWCELGECWTHKNGQGGVPKKRRQSWEDDAGGGGEWEGADPMVGMGGMFGMMAGMSMLMGMASGGPEQGAQGAPGGGKPGCKWCERGECWTHTSTPQLDVAWPSDVGASWASSPEMIEEAFEWLGLEGLGGAAGRRRGAQRLDARIANMHFSAALKACRQGDDMSGPKAKQVVDQVVNASWANSGRLSEAIAVFRAILESSEDEDSVAMVFARGRVNELLHVAARYGDSEEYAAVLKLCVQLGSDFDVRFFAKIMGYLTSRLPVPIGLVRLTLNAALPKDGPTVPLPGPGPFGNKGGGRGGAESARRGGAMKAAAGGEKGRARGATRCEPRWLELADSAGLVEQGWAQQAPALVHNQAEPSFGQAGEVLQHFVGEVKSEVTISDDPEGLFFPEVATALADVGAGGKAAVANCSSNGLWAVGVGNTWQARESAAKLALALVCAQIDDAKMASAGRKYLRFKRLCEGGTDVIASNGDAKPNADSGAVGEAQEAQPTQTEREEATQILAQVKPDDVRGLLKADDPADLAYFGHFATLLHLETLVEFQQLELRLSRPPKDLESQGWALLGLQAQSVASQKLGSKKGGKKRITVAFKVTGGADAARLRIRPGDTVILSRKSPLIDAIGECYVVSVPGVEGDAWSSEWGRQLVLNLDADVEDSQLRWGLWRADAATNRTAYERQLNALVKLGFTGKDQRPAIWDLLTLTGVGGQNVDDWAARGRQGNAGAGGAVTAAPNAKSAELVALADEEPFGADETLKQLRAELESTSDDAFGLNLSQRQAISAALGQRLTLVQGPPGAGKTHVSVALLKLWTQRLKQPGHALLATSDSNIAVDNIAEGALRAGLKVVRVGKPERVSAPLEDITLEIMVKRKHDIAAEADKEDSAALARIEDYALKMAILRQADVICATTTTSGGELLSQLKFRAILVDEVAQATELSVAVPIVLRRGMQLALIGDQCQLPPTVASFEAQGRGLSLSLFSRMAGHGLRPFFLNTQFRMHPSIATFSAHAFYNGELQSGVAPADRVPPQGFEWPWASNVAFVDVADGQEVKEGESFGNAKEAEVLGSVLGDILACGELSVLEVGVVTPYSAQVRRLRQQLRSTLPSRLEGTGVDLTGGLSGTRGQRALEIASVDAFQGREKELIVFSAVRSNSAGKVGFLADWRRLNVMLTRARRGLIVVGHAETLRHDNVWKHWLEWVQAPTTTPPSLTTGPACATTPEALLALGELG